MPGTLIGSCGVAEMRRVTIPSASSGGSAPSVRMAVKGEKWGPASFAWTHD
jgi:hypothetical protein